MLRKASAMADRAWSLVVPSSLGRRIVLSVAIGLALVLVAFSVVAVWSVQEATESAYTERVALADALVWHVDDILGYSLATLEAEAATLTIEPGQPIPGEQAKRLSALRSEMDSFNISVSDAGGVTIWSEPSSPQSGTAQPSVQPGIASVLDSGTPQVTQMVMPDRQRAFASLAVPIRDRGSRTVGVLVAALDPGQPGLNLLPARPMGDALRVQLINTDGWVLAGSVRDDLDSEMDEAHAVLLADLMQRRVAGYRIHELPPLQSADGKVVQVSSHMVAYAPVSLLPAWGVVVEQPKDVVLATPRQLEVRLGLAGIAMLLLAGTVAWLDVRRVVRPLQHLTSGARRFAAGDLEEPILLERSDELGVLAHAFETMRQRLRASLAEVSEWNRELERRVAARTSEVERRNQELATLNAIAETTSGTLDSSQMLERTLDRVLEITGAEMGCFRVAEGESGRLSLAAARGLPDVLRDQGVCSDACVYGRATSVHGQALTGTGGGDRDSEACHAVGLRACVAVPLEAGQRNQGVLFLGSQQAGYFERINLATLSAIGRQVGMALVNARLFESLRARERERAELLQRVIAGQEEERRRLAQELHDQTSQALASLQLGLDRLAAGVDSSAQARRVAGKLRRVAEQTLEEVHHLAVELRPSVLDDVGLVAALQRYVREWAEHGNTSFDFVPVGVEGLRLVPAAETAVYRIVQAALTNIAQHAEAQHVSVILQRREGNLVAVVEDDGRGFDPAGVRTRPLGRRLGLAGMEERAALIGATLTLESTPGAGSSVFLEVPVDINVLREDADGLAALGAG
jgi:signal transduction histidine kinase/HAMP domain-containing protein